MTKDRIDRRFADLKAQNRAGFVTYVMAGDPDAATTLSVLKGLPGAGADLIELGFPFSDPMAEGPTIQKAALRGLQSGLTLKGTLDVARTFRDGDADSGPLLLPLADYATLAGGTEVVRPCIDRFRAAGRIVDHLGVAHLAFPFWTPISVAAP